MNVGVRAATAGTSADLARDIARIGEIFAEGLKRSGGPWLTGAAFRTGQIA
jgi:glutathione S-transferase